MLTKAASMTVLVTAGAVVTTAAVFGVVQLAQAASKPVPPGQEQKLPSPNAEPPAKSMTLSLGPVPTDAPSLAPGVTHRRKLTVTNPNSQPVSLTSVTASVSSPSPGSTTGLQCASPSDIDVVVVPGQLPTNIAAKGGTTKIDIDVVMKNTNFDQNDCKGRTFTYSFTATASSK